jgi:transcriptional regulator with XRE-family HTH domain
MSREPSSIPGRLTGHALRNANLRTRSLARAEAAPPLARALVVLRARVLGMTRLEFARHSGISRGTLRDLELGVHVPTRRTLQQFAEFCRERGVASAHLDEVYQLYTGPGEGLGQLLARLELRAGSPAELARRACLSPATLWEYRRGNFPLPLPVLRRLCQVAGVQTGPAEILWFAAERQRLRERGYPPPLAEFWALCARAGYAEKDLPRLKVSTAALRRLRYLELPCWEEVAAAARSICRTDGEVRELQKLWQAECTQTNGTPATFGALLQQLRTQKGISRRELADLFGIGGKKPARLIQSIEEEGCYSAQAYPAGLAALVAGGADHERLLELWRQRRHRFHARHRPETRCQLRLARECYGFEHKDMEPILGYSALEYQRLERGVGPLAETAHDRILAAIHQAGQHRVETLLLKRQARCAERAAWRAPASVRALITRLAEREGGIIPLRRYLRQAGAHGFGAPWLRAVARGEEVPAWPLLERIGTVCGVTDLDAARRDWRERYRARLQGRGAAPLGVEVRLVVAEVAATARSFSKRLGINSSVLIRALARMDRGKPLDWLHVERILRAAQVRPGDARWNQIHAWWYTTRERRG